MMNWRRGRSNKGDGTGSDSPARTSAFEAISQGLRSLQSRGASSSNLEETKAPTPARAPDPVPVDRSGESVEESIHRLAAQDRAEHERLHQHEAQIQRTHEDAVAATGAREAEMVQGRMSGYLIKRGGQKLRQDWKRRWAVLSGSLMVYFEDATEQNMLGMVVFEGDDKVISMGPEIETRVGRKYVFAVESPTKTLYFQAADADDQCEWVSALRRAQLHFESREHTHVHLEPAECDEHFRLIRMLLEEGHLTERVAQKLTEGEYHRFGDYERYYEEGEVLGQGSFGQVVVVTDKRTGRQYASKSMQKTQESRNQKVIGCEIECLERLRDVGHHPNIISLQEVLESETHVYLVMELAKGRELMDTVTENPRGIPADTARPMLEDIIRAVHWLHQHHVVHRDLKPENVQVTETGVLKIVDFGFGKCLPLPKPDAETSAMAMPGGGCKDPTSVVNVRELYEEGVAMDDRGELLMDTFFGTRFAASPEIWNHQKYTRAVDCWGIGVIAYMLLVGEQPFSEFGGAGELAARVTRGAFTKDDRWEALSESVKDFIAGLLTVDPLQRMTCTEALNHPYLLNTPFSPRRTSATSATSATPITPSTDVGVATSSSPAEGEGEAHADAETAETAAETTPAAGAGDGDRDTTASSTEETTDDMMPPPAPTAAELAAQEVPVEGN